VATGRWRLERRPVVPVRPPGTLTGMTDVTDATFATEVLERSKQVPVVVDLWAPWCAPCRMLGPILERVVAAQGGAVALAKVNVDENPQIAQSFQVQSIPAVFALRDGRVVDSFIGAQPEAAVQEFVSRLLPSEADLLAAQGDEASLRAALAIDPGHERATVALAELLIDKGEREEALALLARVPETAETRRVAARARLGDEASLVNGAVTDRLDALLERVKDDDAARQEFLDLLETMGPDDPRTAEYRRALAARLF
jgi:putative thioredoxin